MHCRRLHSAGWRAGVLLLTGVGWGCVALPPNPPDSDGVAARLNIVRGESTVPARQRIRSWTRIKEERVVIQKQDYSCGAAALATVLQQYFGDDVSEQDLLDQILGELSDEEVLDRQENGLSMNDLFLAAKELGYLGAVYRLPVEKIPQLQAPVIVRIERDEFKHFVVLRGSVEDRVYLADPLRGNVRMAADVFLEQWSGEALILGKPGFGLPTEHGLAIRDTPPVRNELQPMRRWLLR